MKQAYLCIKDYYDVYEDNHPAYKRGVVCIFDDEQFKKLYRYAEHFEYLQLREVIETEKAMQMLEEIGDL